MVKAAAIALGICKGRRKSDAVELNPDAPPELRQLVVKSTAGVKELKAIRAKLTELAITPPNTIEFIDLCLSK